MPDYDADAHADRHTIQRLENLLRARDQEIASLKSVLDRFLKPHTGERIAQEEIEGAGEAEDDLTPREDFTTAKTMLAGLKPEKTETTAD